jgi:tryptophanyl-tRNA synthetase
LKIPAPQINKAVATIPGLDGRKMSKSYGNTIPLFCNEAELLKCIKKITTDSTAPDAPKPADHLIFQLYKYFTGETMVTSIGWGDAKQKLHTAMDAALKPMREKYDYYMAHYDEVEKILAKGATRAREIAAKTLDRVRRAVGVL